MTIRNNGQKRDTKRLLSSVFLFIIALVCLYITGKNGWKWSWDMITAALFYLAIAMFRSANEV